MAITTLEDMFVHQLEEMYTIETRLTEILGEMGTDANDERLSDGFHSHQVDTQDHVSRLESVFDELGIQPERGKSSVLEALVEERTAFHDEADTEELRDLFDVQVGLKTERLEMTGYQGLIALANKLDYSSAVTKPLEDNFSSERATFYRLQAFAQDSKLRSMVSQIMG